MVLLLLGFAYRVLLAVLRPEGLGVYTLVMQVYAIVMSVCVVGLCVASTRMTADLQAHSDYAGIRRMTRFAVYCFLTLLGLLALPILSLREFIAGRILGDPRTPDRFGCIDLLSLTVWRISARR
jgi:O-antigen/teichoic acid export membrane protein